MQLNENILKYIDEIRSRLLNILVVMLILTIGLFSFGIKNGIPVPTIEESISVDVFNLLKSDLIPSNVEPIVTKPSDGILSQIRISFFIALFLSTPLLLFHMYRFFMPAMLPKEKNVLSLMLIFSVFLFLVGSAFAYFLMIPIMIKLLYFYSDSLGVLLFIDVNSFLSVTSSFIIIFGLIFTLPIVMLFLKPFGVSYNFWKKSMKWVILIFVVLGAIITPDGSGITQMMVAVPLILLYVIGMILTKYVKI